MDKYILSYLYLLMASYSPRFSPLMKNVSSVSLSMVIPTSQQNDANLDAPVNLLMPSVLESPTNNELLRCLETLSSAKTLSRLE